MDLREERNPTYGSGNITYYLNQTVTQTPYKEFSSIFTSAAEQVVTLAVTKETTSVIAEFETAAGNPGTSQIVGGLWSLYLHFNASTSGQNWIIRPTILKRDLSGTETLVFTPDPVIVNNMNTTTEMYVSDGVFPNTTLLTTDRLVVRISVQNMGTVSQTINFRTEGSQHYSVVSTTLNPTYNTLLRTATSDQDFINTLSVSPAPLDTMLIEVTDPAASTAKKFSWLNFKTYLLSYFDTIFPRITADTTGSVISFSVPVVWNTPASPSSSNLTDDLTGAKIGYIQKIYHNKATAPTVPAGWVLIGTGTYTTSTLNIIFAEWVSSTRVEYWITKPA